MNSLVTGGAGFIGGHLAERLFREGYDVVILDSMHPYYDLRIKQHTLKRHQEVAAGVGRATGTERTVTGTSRS